MITNWYVKKVTIQNYFKLILIHYIGGCKESGYSTDGYVTIIYDGVVR